MLLLGCKRHRSIVVTLSVRVTIRRLLSGYTYERRASASFTRRVCCTKLGSGTDGGSIVRDHDAEFLVHISQLLCIFLLLGLSFLSHSPLAVACIWTQALRHFLKLGILHSLFNSLIIFHTVRLICYCAFRVSLRISVSFEVWVHHRAAILEHVIEVDSPRR